MPLVFMFRLIIFNLSNGWNKDTIIILKTFILRLKVVSMAKHFVEDIAQTILLEVKAVQLDVGNACTEHNSEWSLSKFEGKNL